MRDTWRDSEGFGRDKEVSAGVWSAVGPDNEDHAIHCGFIVHRGIVPCTCDATRKPYGKDHTEAYTEWHDRWLRWQKARSVAYATQRPMPWPITGPDGEPWVPGIDFNDAATEEEPYCDHGPFDACRCLVVTTQETESQESK